ncbi:MAG: hypothetical protein QFX32_07740 [Methanolinea sp.]|nr:hypothetical protein [Methanolinea sp.]
MLKAMERCPACGSRDIFLLAGGCLGQVYACKECGYRGSLVVACEEDDGEEGH